MTYENWESKYPGCLILIEEAGFFSTFYSAYGESAEVIHELLGYKLHKNKKGKIKCGGPNCEKICKKLEENDITYKVVDDIEILAEWNSPAKVESFSLQIEASSEKWAKLLDYLAENNYKYTLKSVDVPRQNEWPKAPDLLEPKTAPAAPKKNPPVKATKNESEGIAVELNDYVCLRNIDTHELIWIVLKPSEFVIQYIACGGAYDGAGVEYHEISEAGCQLPDGTFITSITAPLGKAVLGKHKGYQFKYWGPKGDEYSYRIESIRKQKS